MIVSIHLLRWDLSSYPAEYVCGDFDFGLDEIDSSITSEFTLSENVQVEKGDWLVAKFVPSGKTAYFGVIDSQENYTIRCRGLMGLGDSEFPTFRTSGMSFEAHARSMLNKYLTNDPTKNLRNILDISVETDTPHTYQATELNARKLNSYLINGFKKYNVKWYFKSIAGGRIRTGLKRIERKIQIKDNSSEFSDWDFFVKKPGSGSENALLIVDKATRSIDNPIILATYYLENDNNVTTNANSAKIIRPTVNKVNIYDQEIEDKPTFAEVADSELKGNAYSHEISCKVIFGAKNIDVENIETGMLATVKVKGTVYPSVLTAWRVTSNENKMQLTFGNIRSRVNDYFDE